MKLNRVILFSALMPMVLSFSVPASSLAFTTNRLVLQQGVIPTTNGVDVGAIAYTGTVDTCVMIDFPTTSYGTDPILHFHKHNVSSNTIHAFIRFDNFQTFLPANATVVGAKLYLTSAGDGDAFGNVNEFGIVNSAWADTMTWNTRNPAYSGKTPIGSWDYGGLNWPSNTVSSLDLTAAVQAWHDGRLSNNGIILNAKEGFNAQYREHTAHSSENSDVAKRPRLEIDYVLSEIFVVGGKTYKRSVIVTNGPSVLEDTFIRSNAVNYAAATKVAWLGTWNYAPEPPERILLRLLMTDPALAQLTRTGEKAPNRPTLVEAQLQFNAEYYDRTPYVDLWKCSQDWVVGQVTGGLGLGTRDGTNPWTAAWTRTISNVDGAMASRATITQPMGAGTLLHFDVTTLLQQYVDGSNNYGFVIGEDGGAWAYGLSVVMSEYPASFMRPTLVMETKTLLMRGTIILLK